MLQEESISTRRTSFPSDLKQKVFDVIVFGSGQPARALARRTAAAGLDTLIVEK